jgi:hypothetical protein
MRGVMRQRVSPTDGLAPAAPPARMSEGRIANKQSGDRGGRRLTKMAGRRYRVGDLDRCTVINDALANPFGAPASGLCRRPVTTYR